MREQHGPGIADPVVEVNTPLGRIGFEVGGDVIDLQCHDPPLKSQRAKVPVRKTGCLAASRGRTIRKLQKKNPADAMMYRWTPQGFEMQSGSPPLLDWPL